MGGSDRDGPRVLVLGGSGFIGKTVVAQLAAQPGIRIRATSRAASGADTTCRGATEVVHCDVLDPETLRKALADIDVVINCCRERADEREAHRFIESLSRGVKEARVRHLIYLSSIAVYGRAGGTISEDTAPVEPLNWYARAKLKAEAACRQLASADLAVTILRPSLVYGPGGEEWSLDFVHSVRRGHLQGLGPFGEGPANLVYVDDLAAFCARLAMRPQGDAATLNVNGVEQVTFNRYFTEIAAALREAGVIVSPARRSPRLAAYARPLMRRGLARLQRTVAPFTEPAGPAYRRFRSAQNALRCRPEDRTETYYALDTHYLPDRAIAAGFAARTSISEGTRQSVMWAIATGRI